MFISHQNTVWSRGVHCYKLLCNCSQRFSASTECWTRCSTIRHSSRVESRKPSKEAFRVRMHFCCCLFGRKNDCTTRACHFHYITLRYNNVKYYNFV